MILVLNEWVFHDLLGDNGEVVQQQTAAFLNAFHASRDKLVWPGEPRWTQKAYQLMTLGDARLRNTSKQFHSLIRDLNRVIDVRTTERVEVPEELRLSLPAEDVYLVEAYTVRGRGHPCNHRRETAQAAGLFRGGLMPVARRLSERVPTLTPRRAMSPCGRRRPRRGTRTCCWR